MPIYRTIHEMNINLGAPYEASIRKIIEKGYAGNPTEVIQQAIVAYEKMLEEEEFALAHRAVKAEKAEIVAGNTINHRFEDVKKGLRRHAR